MNTPKRDKGASKTGDVPGTALLSKAVNILECIGEADTRLRINDLAEKTGYAKPTLYRIISALSGRGFLQIDPRDGAYSLGPRFTELAGTIAQHSDLISISAAPLKRLADKFGETVTLGVLSGTTQQTVAASHGTGVFAASPLGTRKPLYCTALGKALLAFQDKQVQSKLIQDLSFDALTEKTIVSASKLQAELDAIRLRGFALDDEEIVDGVRCISVAILGQDGCSIAAVSVSGPAHRMPDIRRSEIAVELTLAAEEIGDALNSGSGKNLAGAKQAPWLQLLDDVTAFSVTDVSELADGTPILCDGPGGSIYRLGTQKERLLSVNSPILAATLADKTYLFVCDNALWRLDPSLEPPGEAIRLFDNPLLGQVDALSWDGERLIAGCGSALLEIDLTGTTREIASDRLGRSGLQVDGDDIFYASTGGLNRYQRMAGKTKTVCPLEPRNLVNFARDGTGRCWVFRKTSWGLEEYSPEGKLLSKLALPVPEVSFLRLTDRLYVGTERWSLSSAQLDLAPAAGRLIVVDTKRLAAETEGK